MLASWRLTQLLLLEEREKTRREERKRRRGQESGEEGRGEDKKRGEEDTETEEVRRGEVSVCASLLSNRLDVITVSEQTLVIISTQSNNYSCRKLQLTAVCDFQRSEEHTSELQSR